MAPAALPSAAVLLAAFEQAAARPPVARAPALLPALGMDEAPERLTVGECDRRLLELRRLVFGDTLEVVATCPACRADVDLAVAASELGLPEGGEPAATLSVADGGYAIACRVPLNADLEALAACPEERRLGALLERCVLEARDAGGRAVAPGELPEATARAVLEAMADADPGARTALAIRCPCGCEWVDELEVRSILWSDVSAWVGRTLGEVHQLALSYGWPESEVLAMPAWRRRWYAEAAGW